MVLFQQVPVPSDLIRAADLLTVPVACWLGALTVRQPHVVVLLIGIFSVVSDVAYLS